MKTKTATKSARAENRNGNQSGVSMTQLAAIDDEAQRRGTTAPELIHDALQKNTDRKSAQEFRQWLENAPENATLEDGDFPRVKCGIGEIELDVLDWLRVLRLSRDNSQSIEYTLETLLEDALQQ